MSQLSLVISERGDRSSPNRSEQRHTTTQADSRTFFSRAFETFQPLPFLPLFSFSHGLLLLFFVSPSSTAKFGLVCIQSSAREAARVVLLARASVEVCLVVRERRHTRRPTHSAHWPARQAPCSLSDFTRPSRVNSLQSKASPSTGTTDRSTTNRRQNKPRRRDL